MKVLVFDIDGTLTFTNRVDARVLRRALEAVLPDLRLESFDGFSEMTDAAILRDICAERKTADCTAIEARVLEHFVSGLAAAVGSEPDSFSAVPGAHAVFSLVREAGWTPAIATGGWRPSAELKLETANIPTAGVPLATSSETKRRVDIIRLAVAEATTGAAASEIIYVGDGTWDALACRELGIGFVGRAQGDRVDILTEHGARTVVPNFADGDAFLRALATT